MHLALTIAWLQEWVIMFFGVVLYKVQDGVGNNLNVLTILDRGYTGHEHLQSVGLINMNGRIYDAKLHRFLQPDNYVQDPSNTQNYNRYGYVLNNPLKYIDPSGEYGEFPGLGPIDPGTSGVDTEGAKKLMKDLNRFWENTTHAWKTSNTKNMLDKISLNNISKGFDRMGGWFKRDSGDSGPSPNMASNVNINTNSTTATGMFNNFSPRNNAMVSQYVEHAIIPANTVGNYDMTGGIITGIGTGLSAGEIKMFNQNNWFSLKQWKTYSQSFNGNGYTGGKLVSAKKMATRLNWAGKGLGVYSGVSTFIDYQNNKIDGGHLLMEEASNAYSTFGGLSGAAWGIGWEAGRWLTFRDFYQNWKQETWMPWRRENFGY